MLCMMCGSMEALPSAEMCARCEEQSREDLDEIAHLIREGHTSHCARRQVYGPADGCECEMDNLVPGLVSALIINEMEG